MSTNDTREWNGRHIDEFVLVTELEVIIFTTSAETRDDKHERLHISEHWHALQTSPNETKLDICQTFVILATYSINMYLRISYISGQITNKMAYHHGNW